MAARGKADGEGAQLALALPADPSYAAGDFIVGACNAAAHGLVERWPDWPHFAVWLHGPAGAGTTHLAHVWAERADAGIADLAGLVAAGPQALRDRNPHWALELDGGPDDDAAERALFHFYNLIAEAGGALLLIARQPAGRWPARLPDLRSRLAACQAVGIAAPDETVLQMLLYKLVADRQLTLGAPAADFLHRRLPRSYAAVAAFVAALDLASLAERRTITRDLARQVWEAQAGPDTAEGEEP
ncbi:MAG: hypothetical protein R3F55_02125 [Alphaproteobacteria bacterium]